jgi:hypothetical protein
VLLLLSFDAFLLRQSEQILLFELIDVNTSVALLDAHHMLCS